MSSSSQLNREPEKTTPIFRGKSGKAITVIELNIERAAKNVGLDRLGFLTLTFRDHVLEKKEAHRRFNSLSTNVLRERYVGHLVVWERQKSGRLHAHLLVGFNEGNIRRGFDFDAVRRRDYRSASPQLRAEWAYWRRTAPLYGFGRVELLPIRTCAGAMANYVGKYLGKDFSVDSDRGTRRYAASKSFAAANQHHQSVHSTHWRAAMGIVAHELADIFDCQPTFEALADSVPGSSSWVWKYRDLIADVCDVHRKSPSKAHQRAAEGLSGVRATSYTRRRHAGRPGAV